MMPLGEIKTKVFSVKFKFTLFAFCIGLVSFGVAVVFSNLWTVREFEKHYGEKANLIQKHIIGDLEDGMGLKNHGWILRTINDYRAGEDIKELRIFNPTGQEVFSQGQGSHEPRLDEVLRTGGPLYYRKEVNKKQVASYIIPLKNKQECQGCHGKGQDLRGALLVSISLAGMDQDIIRQRQRFFILFALMAIVIGMATVLAANRFFIRPLMSIQKGTEIIERGDFEYQIPFASRDEIGDLARRFNHMARTLRKFLEELEDKNRQLTEQVRLVSLSQKEWQETFDSITDLVAVIGKEFEILRANRAFVEHFSIAPGEGTNPFMQELYRGFVPLDRTPITCELPDANTGKVLQVSVFPYFSPEKDLVGSIFIGKDVTEKKKNEMRLIMSERLSALGQMASGIAHEINNPLATVSACTEGLLKRIKKGKVDVPLFESYLGIIEEELARCKHITTSMLSFVRKKSNGNQKAALNEVLDRTFELVSFQGRLKGVEFLKSYAEGHLTVAGNEGDLRQVFLAIIVNAIDAMGDKGRLEVETGREGDNAFARISDTGPGIPRAIIDRIFDPFFTTKSEKGGTGLGLSIADRIIKENDGRIEVTSEEGRGTTFKIVLPMSSSCPEHEASAASAIQHAS